MDSIRTDKIPQFFGNLKRPAKPNPITLTILCLCAFNPVCLPLRMLPNSRGTLKSASCVLVQASKSGKNFAS